LPAAYLKEDNMMKKVITLSWLGLVIAVGVVWAASAQTKAAGSRNGAVVKGQKLFMQYCATCHGSDGKGQGPVAAALKEGPPDLTLIQAPGEKFPYNRVETVIEGEKAVTAHGSKKMPVWGPIFRKTSGELQSHADIYALVKYIESIQSSSK
jgi:mono/diheme cytochrome c family protein